MTPLKWSIRPFELLFKNASPEEKDWRVNGLSLKAQALSHKNQFNSVNN